MTLNWLPLLWADLKRILGDPGSVGVDTWGFLIGLLWLYAMSSKSKVETRIGMGRFDNVLKEQRGLPVETTEIIIEQVLLDELKELIGKNRKIEAVKLLRSRKNIGLAEAKRILDAIPTVLNERRP